MKPITSIIRNGDAEALVAYAKEHGTALQQYRLTTSQIRGVFSRVRQIEAGWQPENRERSKRQLQLLKPRLAYQAAKERGRGVEQLRDILTEAIDEVFAKDANGKEPSDEELSQRFERFVELFEALLAYHRAADGR